MPLDEPGYPLWLPRWCPYSSGYHPQPWKHPWALLKIPSIKRMTNTLMLFGSVLMLPSPPELHWSMWFIASGFICRFFPFEQLVYVGFSIIDIEPKTCFSKASFFRSAMANLSNMLAKVFFSFSCILILLHSMTEGCQVHLSIHLLSFNFLLALGDLVLGSLFQKVCSQYSAPTQKWLAAIPCSLGPTGMSSQSLLSQPHSHWEPDAPLLNKRCRSNEGSLFMTMMI